MNKIKKIAIIVWSKISQCYDGVTAELDILRKHLMTGIHTKLH